MIHAVVIGNLGADPELKYGQDGTPILNLRVAASSRQKVDGEWKDVATWCSVAVFGKRGESLAKILDKGTRVAVRGALSVREYDKRDGGRGYSIDVRADEVELLGSKGDGAGGARPGGAPRSSGGARPNTGGGGGGRPVPAPAPAEPDDVGSEDDIPF